MKQARQRNPAALRPNPPLIALVLLLAVVFVYPFLWMLVSGFKSNPEIFRPGQFLPEVWDGEHYARLTSGEWFPFWRVYFNSLIVATSQALGAVAITALAGYAFAQHAFRGRKALFILAITVIVLPQAALAVPLFTWLMEIRLTDRLAGVILPGMVSGIGVVYFTLVFAQVPRSLIEAARVEGASEFRVFRVLLPLMSSSLLSYGLIHFILAWHDHLVPLLVLDSRVNQTLPVALASLYGSSMRFPYAVLMAGSTLTLIPTVLLFAVFYRRFKSALSELMGG